MHRPKRWGAALTFDAQGTFFDPQHARITNGTFQVTNSSSGQTMYSELINGGAFTNNTDGGLVFIAVYQIAFLLCLIIALK